jgi:hypothetical protein
MVSRIEENFLGSYKIKLDSAYPIDRYIMELGTWELHVVHLIHRFVKPGDVCVDVGANAGYHTLPMAGAVGAKGCVYAFEPNDITYTKLIENLELNPTLKERVSVVKMGLSSEEGEMKIFQSGAEPGNAYISNTFKEELWNMGTGRFHTMSGCPVGFVPQRLERSEADYDRCRGDGVFCAQGRRWYLKA